MRTGGELMRIRLPHLVYTRDRKARSSGRAVKPKSEPVDRVTGMAQDGNALIGDLVGRTLYVAPRTWLVAYADDPEHEDQRSSRTLEDRDRPERPGQVELPGIAR